MASHLHFHLVQSIATALDEIFLNSRYADKVIEYSFKQNRKWGARDRKFFAEGVYEIVRHKRFLSFVADATDSWSLVGAYLYRMHGEFPDWEELAHLNPELLERRSKSQMPPEVKYSFPDWLAALGQEEFKEDWPELMRALNVPAEVFLRVNALKADVDKVVSAMASEDIELEKISSDKFDLSSCLKLKKRKNVFATNCFKKGFFEVQDAASQLIAPLLETQPSMRVVDACAGAGGKSLHIAATMKNKGKIISMDIHEWKLKELKTRAARAGVDIIETKVIESSKTVKRLEQSFDRVLLDVPCSGLGVVRRNPDTKWKLTMEEIVRLQNLQKEILSQYSKMCKSGGLMVYATCSILHRENEEQVQWFLSSPAGQGWTLKKQLRVWPHIDHYDGFYAAVLVKS